MSQTKRIEVAFYRTVAGQMPVRNWLLDLTREERRIIGEDIKAIEFGWPIGMPVCKSLGRGLFEVRSNLRDRIARIMFIIADSEMVLLHSFFKATQKTARGDMDLARKRQREWEAAK